MLMRDTETVDYTHVPDHHKAIHERLENWEKWLRPRISGWHTHPMWRDSRTRDLFEVAPA